MSPIPEGERLRAASRLTQAGYLESTSLVDVADDTRWEGRRTTRCLGTQGSGFRVCTLSGSRARVDVSGRALAALEQASAFIITLHPICSLLGFKVLFIVHFTAGAVSSPNRGGGRLLMRRRQSHRCHVCVWGRRSVLHSMCWFQNVWSALGSPFGLAWG